MPEKPTYEELVRRLEKLEGTSENARVGGRPCRFALALTICIAFLWAVPKAGTCYMDRDPQETIIAKGSDTYAPYSFLSEAGNIEGFNNELFEAVSEVADLKANIELGPWPIIRKELESGKIDVITGMYHSEERDKSVDFCVPHILVKYCVFACSDSQMKSPAELNGKEIIVMRGAFPHDFLKEKGIVAKIVTTEDTPTALRLLASGKHDCAILVRLQGIYFQKKLKIKNVKSLGEPFALRKFCFAVKEGDSHLLARLNEGLFIIKETGKYNEIYNKWFGILEREVVPVRQILLYATFILAPIIGLLLASFFWTWSLRRRVKTKTKELGVELSEHKRAEEALQESEERYRTLVSNIPGAVFRCNEEWNILYISDAIEEITGYPPTDFLNNRVRSYASIMYQEDIKIIEKIAADCLDKKRPIEVEYRIVCNDGSIRWVHDKSQGVFSKLVELAQSARSTRVRGRGINPALGKGDA